MQKVIEAPVQAVWDRYTDHRSWTEWAGVGTVRLDRPGVPPPNGVGSVRAISSAGVKVLEEVEREADEAAASAGQLFGAADGVRGRAAPAVRGAPRRGRPGP